MELDLFDAIRLHLIVQIDAANGRYVIEPYELTEAIDPPGLLAFAIAGPTLGWKQFADWKNLKITSETFESRR